MRWLRFLSLGFVTMILLTGFGFRAGTTSRGLSPAEIERRMADVNRRVHAAFRKGDVAAAAAVLTREGFVPVPGAGTGTPVSGSSYGSDLALSWIRFYWNPKFQRYYTAGYWDWIDGNWDYWEGALDTVSMHFVTEDGKKAKKLLWGNGSGAISIKANEVNGHEPDCHQDAWVHKYDISGGGIIFTFQDYTHWTGLYMCGDSGLVTGWFSEPPEKPFYAVFSYEHTWDDGRFEDASIGADSDGKLSLSVTYSESPEKWKTEAIRLYR